MSDLSIHYTYTIHTPYTYLYNQHFTNSLTINMHMWSLVMKEALPSVLSMVTRDNVPESVIEAILATGEALKEEKDVTVIFAME